MYKRQADGQLSSLYPPSPSFSSSGAASVMFCCSAIPARSSTPSVQYPSISLVVKLMCIQTLCDHLKALYIFDQTYLHRFEVRLELYSANARLIVNPPPLSPSHLPTPPPCRWPTLTTLPPLAKFQLVWCRLCEALLLSLIHI